MNLNTSFIHRPYYFPLTLGRLLKTAKDERIYSLNSIYSFMRTSSAFSSEVARFNFEKKNFTNINLYRGSNITAKDNNRTVAFPVLIELELHFICHSIFIITPHLFHYAQMDIPNTMKIQICCRICSS